MKSNTLSWQAHFSDKELIRMVRENNVILAPSDTVWGLCGAATKEVFQEFNRLKVRNEKPYLLLAHAVSNIKNYAFLPDDPGFQSLLKTVWPGPVTIIFRALPDAPPYMVGAGGTIAFRIPRHEGLQILLETVSVLFSTSANISGSPVPRSFSEIDPQLREQVAACVVPQEGELVCSTVPSTIIDISTGVLRLVREGAVPFVTLQGILKEKEIKTGE